MTKTSSLLMIAFAILAPLCSASPLLLFAPLLLVIGSVTGKEGSTTTCSADDDSCQASAFSNNDNNEMQGEGRCCFLEGSTVEVLGKGLISMQDLQLMDRVLTGNDRGDKFQPVYAFGQRKKLSASKRNTLIRIEIRASGTTESTSRATILEVPGEHILLVVDEGGGGEKEKTQHLIPLRADSVRVGDVVRLGENHPNYNNGSGKFAKKVITNGIVGNISEATVGADDDRFYYAPLTKDGTIVVDGILTSTYAATVTPQTAASKGSSNHAQRVMTMTSSERDAIHMFLRPLRVVCFLVPSLKLGALIPDSTGNHLYVSFGLMLAEIYKQGGFSATILMILFYLVFGSIAVIENVVFIYIPRVVIVSVSKFFTVFMPAAALAVLSCFDALDYLLIYIPYGLIVVPLFFILVIGSILFLIRKRRLK